MSEGIEEIVRFVRLSLYNKGLFRIAQANLRKPADVDIPLPPSFRAINWIRTRTSRRIENASDGSRLDWDNKTYREKCDDERMGKRK